MSELPAGKRLSSINKTRMRNLPQYKKMTEDEFEAMWERKATGIIASKVFEDRIQRKIEEFGVDYDLDDLKANDKLTLRALAQAYISLEDYESYSYNMRAEISEETILSMAKLNEIMSKLRTDISNMQNDLKITRRIRKGDKEESVINYLEDLKIKAKKFYEQRMSYIFCPKCNMLLGTIWTLYPDYKTNKISLTCHRKLDDGSICGTEVNTTTKELLEMKGTNNPNIMPEGML